MLGLHVERYDPNRHIADLKRYLSRENPVIFDIGANQGQTLRLFQRKIPRATIHSFEPSPGVFSSFLSKIDGPNLHVWNMGIGAKAGKLTLHENERSDLTSFLPIGTEGWGAIVRETSVEVTTIDDFCQKYGIEYIDVLKSDTQGFEYEVFKGADRWLSEGRIGLIYFELLFTRQYGGQPSYGAILDFLVQRDYRLVRFYEMHGHLGLTGWTNVLFVHDSLVNSG